jgi:signal peptidase I
LAAARQLDSQAEARRAQLSAQGISKVDVDTTTARNAVLAQPWWLDWTAGLFPVILIVFVLRSFLFEPFKIPSGSMIPTLQVGDLILVNKYHYGIRLPVLQTKIIANNEPKRGDVVVFRYPLDPRIDYIKRVVGLPGDEVSYRNQKLYLNGKLIDTKPMGEYYDDDSLRYSPEFEEHFDGSSHTILVDPNRSSALPGDESFPFKDQCTYNSEGVTCKVPPGNYFMMGDNRDNSQDSRYWGFVPDENIVGKAFLVWMNFSNLKRIGTFH